MSMSNSLPPETEQLLGAANFESMAQRLSVRFSQILREWLSESEMAEVLARNAAETNPQICHSHDFADPNQAMLDAAKDLGFREIDVLDGPLSSAGIDLWNAAWNLAKSNDFEPDHVHCSDQGKGHHSDGRFNVLEQTLDDKSKVFDVYFCSSSSWRNPWRHRNLNLTKWVRLVLLLLRCPISGSVQLPPNLSYRPINWKKKPIRQLWLKHPTTSAGRAMIPLRLPYNL